MSVSVSVSVLVLVFAIWFMLCYHDCSFFFSLQIPQVVYSLRSLIFLFLRFNRIRVIDEDIRNLTVRKTAPNFSTKY